MRRLLPAVLLLAACATTPPDSPPPQWTSVPPSIVDAVCARMRSEGISNETQVELVSMTQPIISANSMTALGQFFGKGGNAAGFASALNQALPPMPVVSTGGTCRWTPVDRIEPSRDQQRMVLQLSAPFVNPYAHGESGLFARLSIGGQAPQWYWVPLANRNGQWVIGLVTPLDLHEE